MTNDYFQFIKFKEGDINTFEIIFRKYYKPLFQYAVSIIREKEQAEEIVQEMFYILWKDREKIKILTSFKSYLYKSVKNRSLQYLEHLKVRERHIETTINQYNMSTVITPEECLEIKELEEIISKTLNKLPEKCRQIFNLYYNSGKKYKEIAETLSVSVKTVEAQMTKAYKALRNEIDKYSK